MEFGAIAGMWGVGLGRWRCERGVFVVEKDMLCDKISPK